MSDSVYANRREIRRTMDELVMFESSLNKVSRRMIVHKIFLWKTKCGRKVLDSRGQLVGRLTKQISLEEAMSNDARLCRNCYPALKYRHGQ